MFTIFAALANEINAQNWVKINEQNTNRKTKTIRENHRQEYTPHEH